MLYLIFAEIRQLSSPKKNGPWFPLSLLDAIESLNSKEVITAPTYQIRAMADDHVSAKPVPGDKNEQNLIPGDTPAQEGPSMGVSMIRPRIYFISMLIQSCRSIVLRIGQLVSLM